MEWHAVCEERNCPESASPMTVWGCWDMGPKGGCGITEDLMGWAKEAGMTPQVVRCDVNTGGRVQMGGTAGTRGSMEAPSSGRAEVMARAVWWPEETGPCRGGGQDAALISRGDPMRRV